jgi:ankyrin repeat protein
MQRNSTPLHFAAYGAHREVLEYLLSHGASVEARDEVGGALGFMFVTSYTVLDERVPVTVG